MSSTHPTTEQMTAIEKILGEIRPALIHGSRRRTAAACFLAERFDKESEMHLRAILSAYVKRLDSHQSALAQWKSEGGAVGTAPRTEARRWIDNDTSGMRRRDRETAARHRLI
ncbi:hypothetical protein EN836_28255 [Mesorhizobium sp. M1C.F.Ca.ET.193.01.1.1]|uniref:hypothetical protein n=2 Tax=Mesorhizobium TaxID=68287 RepID=UPI000FD3E583|nr:MULTISPECIES: hypothetical protein [unclassified Mesorhizobium]TGS93355.1 hypothetical protein EN820_48915 [bacterium M00.F.Ca.ET.177.01.1.1]RWA69651.1 MAG: hypothetical protein EOQ28_22395 [Mesorhizobium sp.]RWB98448.1 MAG: hypothetical protein EOQ57_21785 [Mesorhizobium sp.]TGQ50632.1 hypothetical protein EN853_28245 [Mesorhizobium sp. M1C.F.Ca.ET.210.01.1.1]TGQ65803.1 hypothetical protein EN855_028260 [Mesorhizobium sp. M1C.F.Ca.ET.212.01.1.1]